MNDLAAISTLANNMTTSTLDCTLSANTCTGIYNPYVIQYDPCNYTITASTFPTIEKDSNELKINIKKFQIKFNFNL